MTAAPSQARRGLAEREVHVDPGVPARPLRWSASSVSTFVQCPLKLWWGKVAGWQEGPSTATAAGSAVHEALEVLLAEEPGERTPPVAERALAASLEGMREETSAAGIPFNDVRVKAEGALGIYWQVEDPREIDVLPDGIEREVALELGGVPFIGYIDRLARSSTGALVTDYKTGAAKPKYLDGYYRQQYLYAAAMLEQGVDVTEIELLFLGDGRRVRRPVYDAALDRAIGTLRDTAEQADAMVSAGRWTARQSPLCGWCSFEGACPLRRTGVPTPGSAESDALLARVPGMTRRERS